MAPTVVLLLQLLLVSLASASHHVGGLETYTYKGRNSDGSFRVDIRSRSTFTRCIYNYYWRCPSVACPAYTERAVIETGRGWCETESISTMNVRSDKPFERRADSCCWIRTRNGVRSWHLLTHLNLGTRSDTRQPNRSPDIGIVPYIRVPQNCPRTYKIMAYDPDGDRVRCRYGRISLPQGFYLDQDTCTLYYRSGSSHPYVFGVEMVVEDFARSHITVAYTDGSRLSVAPLSVRKRKRRATTSMTTSSTTMTTTAPTSTTSSTTMTTTAPTSTTRGTTRPTTAPTTRGTTRPTTAPTTRGMTWPTTAPTTRGTTWPTTAPTTRGTTRTTTAPTTRGTTRTTAAATTRYITTNSGHLNASLVPLSKLPLQFSFLVDSAVPSCQEGLYLPKFVSPTPANGERVPAEVTKELEIKVKAQVTFGSVQDIYVSGPMNISNHKNTQNEFVIRWTPHQDDLGNHYAICFVVETLFGHRIYQSEMRCVRVDVSNKRVKTHVTCTESTMTVMVEKASFSRLHEDHLRLSDPSNVACSLQTHSNSTHVIGVIPLNACGTQIEEDDDYLYFKNEITPFDNSRDLITRKHLLEVQFFCQYPKRGNVTLGFLAHRKNVTVWEKGFGTFTYSFEFYSDNQFQSMINPNLYPLEYDLGDDIYMQIEATSSINNTELFVESCRAAPYDTPNYSPTYSIIERGCIVEPTAVTYTGNNKEFRFSIEAFKFIGLHNQVYISCSVMMCEAGNPNTRCSQGCINSTLSGATSRRKREAVIQSANHFVSQGPLRLRRSAESREAAVSWNLNLNLVFITGCLLAAVGMVCGVVMYKAKTSKAKYQPLPDFEH